MKCQIGYISAFRRGQGFLVILKDLEVGVNTIKRLNLVALIIPMWHECSIRLMLRVKLGGALHVLHKTTRIIGINLLHLNRYI